MIDVTLIASNITFLRQQKGITQQELAGSVNVTHQVVSKWENASSVPDLQTLIDLTRLFDITLDELLTKDLTMRNVSPERAEDTQSEPGESAEAAHIDEEQQEPEKGEQADEKSEKTNDTTSRMPLHQLTALAPFLPREQLGKIIMQQADSLKMRDLVALAPFLGRDALGATIERMDANALSLSENGIPALAPFLGRDGMDKVLQRIDFTNISMDWLTSVAPFTHRDTLGKFV